MAHMLHLCGGTIPGRYDSGLSQLGSCYCVFTSPIASGDSFKFVDGDPIGEVKKQRCS